jgi:hypothetical protein
MKPDRITAATASIAGIVRASGPILQAAAVPDIIPNQIKRAAAAAIAQRARWRAPTKMPARHRAEA